MTIPLSGSPTVGLGRFIKESRFIVPSHQRDYSWTDEYVTAFLRDIEEAISKQTKTYFCGLMVFTASSPVVFKVLDGQQRLATTLMIFSAVRNWFAKFGEFDTWKNQAHEYLGSRELGSTITEARLVLTAANNDAFRKYVIESVPLSEMQKALKTCNDRSIILIKSAILVNKHFEQCAEKLGDKERAKDEFINILKYLSDYVHIVRFVLDTDSAAYTMFETLNDRGLALSPLDLVKNYVFSNAEKYSQGALVEFEGRWTEMMALLSSPKADSFLRAFWASRHGKPEGSNLFGVFKNRYDDPLKIYQISIDMRADAERYAALFSSNDPIWSGFSFKARQSVDALTTVGLSQAYPMVLAALGKFDKHETERLLWLIECIAVRHQLIGRRRPGRVESLGGRAARDISDGKIKTATGVFSVIPELYGQDDEFKFQFSKSAETNSRKIRYLLSGIERQSLQHEGKTFYDELAPYNVTVEHIFPKSPSEEWKLLRDNDDGWEEHMEARLGNLTLLPGINQALGNKPWSEKLPIYEKSRLNITNKLSKHAKWTSREIKDRQKNMAELAASAWYFQ
jgi:hypothetical protein